MREQDPHAPVLPIALRVVRRLRDLTLLAALGCGARDPWAGTVALPADVDDVRSSVLSLRGVPAGTEDRTTGRDGDRTVVVRRRTWSFVIDGEVETVRAATRTEHDGRHAVAWTDGTRTWHGAAFVPDLFPPPSTGNWPVLDAAGEVQPTVVEVRGSDVAWTVGSVPARATFDAGGRLVSASLGALALGPGARDLVVAPIDPAELSSVVVGDIALPAHPVVATFRVGAEVVEVRAPLLEELRSEEAAEIRALIRAVGSEGDCEARAGRFAGLARARGIDARVVAGLALDREQRRLVPHAWAEVWLGGRWVAVDPTWSLVPADAARLSFGVASRAEAAAELLSAPPIEVLSLR
jgi:hypothetical protein